MRSVTTGSAGWIRGATLAAALVCASLVTPTAQAEDRTYWVNFGASKISYSPLLEGSGADVPISAATVNGPWGLAIDAAAGRAYWANESNDTIGYSNLDGSAAGLLNTTGATVDTPSGLAIDPSAGRVYWANFDADKISYANLDGSGGGDLNTTGATVEGPSSVVVYPASNRVYWTNYTANKISFANVDGSGGADLDTGSAPLGGPEGAAIDATTGRIYWTNIDAETIGYAALNGAGGGQFDMGGLIVGKPVGIAIEPGSRIYWGNTTTNLVESTSLGFAGGGWNIQGAGATHDGVAFPVLLQTPRMSQFPVIQGLHKPGTTLSCSSGKWEADLVESFLYRAPQSFSYQWFRNRKPIAGATAPTLVAEKVGKYNCEVTASNAAGTDTEPSLEIAVNATLRLGKTTFNRRKGTATVSVTVTGAGRLATKGKGVTKAQRKRISGKAKIVIRAGGKAKVRLHETGKARVKATIAYTPEGGKAIKRQKTVVLKKTLRR